MHFLCEWCVCVLSVLPLPHLGSAAPHVLLVLLDREPTTLAAAESHGLLPQSVDLLARLLAAGRRTRFDDAEFMLRFLTAPFLLTNPPGLASRLAAVGGVAIVVSALAHPAAGSGEEERSAGMVCVALKLLLHLLLHSPERAEWFSAAGGLPPLVRLLAHPAESVAVLATGAVGLLVALFADPAEPPACVRRLLDAGAVAALKAALRRPLEEAHDGGGGGMTTDAQGIAVHASGALFFTPKGRLLPRVLADFGPLDDLFAWLAPRPPLQAVRAVTDLVCYIFATAEEERREAMAAAHGLVPRVLRLLSSRAEEYEVGGGGGGGGGDGGGGGACAHDGGTCAACAEERLEMYNGIVLGAVEIMGWSLCSNRQRAAYMYRAGGATLRRLALRGPTDEIKATAGFLLAGLENKAKR